MWYRPCTCLSAHLPPSAFPGSVANVPAYAGAGLLEAIYMSFFLYTQGWGPNRHTSMDSRIDQSSTGRYSIEYR